MGRCRYCDLRKVYAQFEERQKKREIEQKASAQNVQTVEPASEIRPEPTKIKKRSYKRKTVEEPDIEESILEEAVQEEAHEEIYEEPIVEEIEHCDSCEVVL